MKMKKNETKTVMKNRTGTMTKKMATGTLEKMKTSMGILNMMAKMTEM